jgi:hypothetical protein
MARAVGLLSLWVGLVGCERAGEASDTDTDTMADTDTDAVPDTDTDSASDTDTGGDTDPSGDSDTDTSGGSDSDTGGDSDTDTGGDSDTDTGGDTDTGADTDTDTGGSVPATYTIDDGTIGTLDGAFGYNGAVGLGDFDADGALDLATGVPRGDGSGWLFLARDWWAGGWTSADADAAIAAYSWTWASFGAVPRRAGDQDGDGDVDVVYGGSDGYWDTYGNAAVSVYLDAPSGASYTGGADLMLGGLDSAAPSRVSLVADLDANGDGVDEVLWANPTAGHYFTSAWIYPGTAAWVDVAGLSGRTDLAPELHVVGADDAYLGYAVGGGDIDGDGYEEAVVAAPYDATGGSNAGAVYVFAGGASFGGSGKAADLAALTVVGLTDQLVGLGQHTLLEDLDGDGALDMVVPTGSGEVWLFSDVASDSGTLDETNVDIALGSSTAAPDVMFGATLEAGDFDGDGVLDLAIGAPGGETGGSALDPAGAVYVVPGGYLAGPSVDVDTSSVRYDGVSAGHNLGAGLVAGDLADDGVDDLVIAAPGARTYFLADPLL